MKGEEPERPVDQECLVDVQVQAHIPEEYIDSLPLRLDVYRRIAEVATQEEAMDVTDELIDRFGEPPAAVKGLIDVGAAAGHRRPAGRHRGAPAGGFPPPLPAKDRHAGGGEAWWPP